LAGRYRALYQLESGGDPGPSLDQARSDLGHALELNPQIFWAYPEMVAVDLLAARWSMRAGASPEASLATAARSAERALAANPRNAVAYQSAAEVRRWRAEWLLSIGAPVGAEIAEGRRLIEQAHARNPGLASAFVTDAALLVIQAKEEANPSIRRSLASEAAEDLSQALAENPLLKRENEGLRSRIEALLAAQAK
jgi:tetratricopeptide (TPR) repeat protein